MKRLFLAPQVYLAFAATSFQKRMQYRVANLAGLTTNFFFLLVHVFVYTAFYASQAAPQPLNLNEVITYFVLCQVTFMLMPFWGNSSDITNAIKDGSVALQLTKPVDFQTYWFMDECGRSGYYLLMRGAPTFLIGCLLFQVAIPQQPAVFIAFAVSLLLSIFLSIAITVTIFSSAFWTLDTTGIATISGAVIMLFSGMLVPISLWPDGLAGVARWLPFDGLIDVPFSIYLGKRMGGEAWVAISRQLGWSLFFLLAGRVFLRRGFSRLVIQGG